MIKLLVLAVVFCCLAIELGAGQAGKRVQRRPGQNRPAQGGRLAQGGRPIKGGRRVQGGRPLAVPRRPAVNRRNGGALRRKRPGQYGNRNAASVSKPQYGTAQIKPNGNAGKYRFAQGQQKPAVRKPTYQSANPSVKNRQALSVSMPTLANLLYKYAAKSSKPIYVNNPYQPFGPVTYGPMPKPTGYTAQHQQQQLSYQTPVHRPQPVPQQVYRPAVVQQQVSYQKPMYAVTPAPTMAPPAPQRVYYQPAPQPQPKPQPQPMVYQAPRYPAPAPAPAPASYPTPAPASPAPAPRYMPVQYQPQPHPQPQPKPQVVSYAAPAPAAKSAGYYAPAPVAPSCPAPGNFCHYKKAGHYTNPATNTCFIQCDAFGRGYSKPCSPGTSWKPIGPEPALWNMCS